IVLDRVVTGFEYRVAELPAGKYFWRVAPLGAAFSALSGVIDIRATANTANPTQITPRQIQPATQAASTTQGGWYAAVGSVSAPIVAHLRSTAREDIVAISSNGRLVALDAASGVELWAVRLQGQSLATPLAVKSANGL